MVIHQTAPMFASAQAAEEAFYEAMQRGDIEGLMALWVDDEETICIHPNGPRIVGLQRIRESWTSILRDGGLDVRPATAQVYSAASQAVHSVIERILVDGQAGQQVVECLATNVYQKTAAGWRLLIHHSSPASPAGAAEPVPSAGNATLH